MFLRSKAELDNFQKRTVKQIQQAQLYSVEKLSSELLVFIDSLEAAANLSKGSNLNIDDFIVACDKLKKDKTGAIFVFERNNNLDFVKEDGDTINAELSLPIIESIFYKNSPLHDGAVIVVGNIIVASRVTLPVSKNRKINKSLGLRHKAGIGITEESDAISIVISEETGKLSYIKNGKIVDYKNDEELKDLISNDLLD